MLVITEQIKTKMSTGNSIVTIENMLVTIKEIETKMFTGIR